MKIISDRPGEPTVYLLDDTEIELTSSEINELLPDAAPGTVITNAGFRTVKQRDEVGSWATVDLGSGGGGTAEVYLTTSTETNLSGLLKGANGNLAVATVDASPTASSTNPVQSGGVYTALSGKAPTDHASSATTYGKGTSSNYGHVKLSDATNSSSSTSDGVAATPAAVKSAYDLANGKAPTSHASSATTYGMATSSNYGHVKLSDAFDDPTLDPSSGVAATPSAIAALAGDLLALEGAIDLKAPTSHASSATTYGKGTSSNYGHVKLSDATNSSSSTSDGVAATPAAVKAAYDLADSKLLLLSFSDMGADNTVANLLASLNANLSNTPNGAMMIRVGSSTNRSKCLIVCIKPNGTTGRGLTISPYTDLNGLNLYLSSSGWSISS